jgi:hypothetical protein
LTLYSLWNTKFIQSYKKTPENTGNPWGRVMFAYHKYGKRFAFYAEMSKALGARPFLKLNTCKGETILNIPYGQIILTGGAKLKAEAEHHDSREQYTDISQSPARVAED